MQLVKPTSQPQRRWLLGLLLAGGLLLAFRVPAQIGIPAPAGLIGFWPGDGNANDLVSSNNGTIFGGASASAPGFVDSGFLLDGSTGYVSIPDSPALHPTNMTIEAWVRCDNLNTPYANSYPGQEYIVFKQNVNYGDFEGFDLAKDREPRGTIPDTNDTWCFELTPVTGTITNTYVESKTIVQTNVWYHIAGVRGPDYIQIYVNGVLEAQTSATFPTSYGPEPMYFGTTGQSYWDHKFGGAIDEVALYNRALSSNEIAAIYAAGRHGKLKTPTIMAMGMSNGVLPPSQRFPKLTVGGVAGQPYGIQTASELSQNSTTWVGLTNLVLPASTNVWIDPLPVAPGQKYYRIVPGTVSVP